MRILLDECLPRKLKRRLAGHDCQTVPDLGLAGRKNGELLTLAENRGFQIFLTMDRGIEYSQNFTGRQIATVVLRATSNRFADLLPLVDVFLDRMNTIQAGQFVRIGE
jgi:predicted nuclease of predicted toxin-antitoxin system